ncbi:winged helix-turn-helix domain-containing protein [Pluralibacter gergoviae]
MGSQKYILDDQVLFSPDENKLSPLGARGRETQLNAPTARLLTLLLEQNGNVVAQNDIYDRVWAQHGQQISSSTLYQNISLLRKALKKAGLFQKAIGTYPKKGFFYSGRVEVVINHDAGLPSADSAIREKNESSNPMSIESNGISSTQSELESNASKKNILIANQRKLVIASAIAIISIINYFFYVRVGTTEFHSTQALISRVEGCPLYLDKKNESADIDRFTKFIKEKKVECSAHEFLYITKLLSNGDVVALKCNSSDHNMKCALAITFPK